MMNVKWNYGWTLWTPWGEWGHSSSSLLNVFPHYSINMMIWKGDTREAWLSWKAVAALHIIHNLATPPTQRKTSTVEELHSFPWLLVKWGKMSRISCNTNKRHHACTNPHPPQPFTAVRVKCHFQAVKWSQVCLFFLVLFESLDSI